MSSPDDRLASASPPSLDDVLAAPAAAAGADHAVDVLLAVRAQIAPEISEELLRQCYAIQKQFQFDRDEQLPIVRTRRLVEGFVEREVAAQGNGQPEGAR
jgi:hypothetical protein